jgi:hypothetical protein
MIDLWALWPFPARLSDAARHFYDKVVDVAAPLLGDWGYELTLRRCVYVLLSRPCANKAFYSFGAPLCPTADIRPTSFMPVADAPDTLKLVAPLSDRGDWDFYHDIRVSRLHVAHAIRDYRWACGAEDKTRKYTAWRLATAARVEWGLFLLTQRLRNLRSSVRPYVDWRFYARGLAMMAGLN